jgi:predicted NAD-dependent protein-ADP-ribosyltransferase YbiA (DUF1768 family)
LNFFPQTQKKPDFGVRKFREWADQNHVAMILAAPIRASASQCRIGRVRKNALHRNWPRRRVFDRQGLHALRRITLMTRQRSPMALRKPF